MNLFEQQARLDVATSRGFTADAAQVARWIAQADLAQCAAVADALAERVSDLEGGAFGLEDVAAELHAAAEQAPCACGRCDGCVAAASDARHDRRVDRLLMEAA